jgi:asparagine synthase (glutamine-hydrolysing)
MCGILSILRYNEITCNSIKSIKKNFNINNQRGPEASDFVYDKELDYVLGFHRLAINGCAEPESMQPLELHDKILICNGEIYNWRELAILSESHCTSGSDCEIILHLYEKFGIENTLTMLDGVFAFTLIDKTLEKAFVARDPFGVRPLFVWSQDGNYAAPMIFASELKLGQNINSFEPKPFPPGHFIDINLQVNNKTILENIRTLSTFEHMVKPFYLLNQSVNTSIKTKEMALPLIRNALISAVEKRIKDSNRDRGAVCLLSGGLDSSLISALVAKYLKDNGNNEKLHTWSIGMTGSEDLKYARIVAEHIGSIHHEVLLTENEFLNAIPDVIKAIESNDTTTVRASVGNWLISKYIRENSDDKIVFNGDGSDEVTGGYLYFHCAPNSIQFDLECKRLLKDIHLFDVLRSDRSISTHGLEARTPFLDKNFVDTYLSIPVFLRDHKYNNECEKYLLREAFKNTGLLPDSILFRTKEAFSDGVSTDKKSWFEVIQDFAVSKTGIQDRKEAEQAYYDDIFNQLYRINKYGKVNTKYIMPYKWMPKFVNATDASARTLNVYKKINTNEKENNKLKLN